MLIVSRFDSRISVRVLLVSVIAMNPTINRVHAVAMASPALLPIIEEVISTGKRKIISIERLLPAIIAVMTAINNGKVTYPNSISDKDLLVSNGMVSFDLNKKITPSPNRETRAKERMLITG